MIFPLFVFPPPTFEGGTKPPLRQRGLDVKGGHYMAPKQLCCELALDSLHVPGILIYCPFKGIGFHEAALTRVRSGPP